MYQVLRTSSKFIIFLVKFRKMNLTDRVIAIGTETIGFTYHPPDEVHPYNGAPIGQFRKFLRRNKNRSVRTLVSYLVKSKEVKVFDRLVQLGLERSEELKQALISSSVEQNSYEVLQEANRIRYIGRVDLPEIIPAYIMKSLKVEQALPHSYLTIVIALKNERLWDYSYMAKTPYDVASCIETLQQKWRTLSEEMFLHELNLITGSIVQHDDLDAFKMFYSLIPDQDKENLCFSWETEKYSAYEIAKWLLLNKFKYIRHPFQYSLGINVEQNIAAKNWLAIANAPDYCVRKAVKNNSDWIWTDYAAGITLDHPGHYVDLSHMIVFGAKFANRHTEIERIRRLLG